MKKIIAGLAMGLTLAGGSLAMTGCDFSLNPGGNPPSSETGEGNNNTNTGTNTGSNTGENTQTPSDEYTNYATVPLRDIYINYKSGRRKTTRVSITAFYGNITDMVVLAYDEDSSNYTGTAADAFNLINDGRIFKGIETLTNVNFRDWDTQYLIELVSSENLTINQREMMKFTASVTSTGGRVCYIYGYSFVIDNTPCVLSGIVLTADQEESLKASIRIEVDSMIQTLRTKR